MTSCIGYARLHVEYWHVLRDGRNRPPKPECLCGSATYAFVLCRASRRRPGGGQARAEDEPSRRPGSGVAPSFPPIGNSARPAETRTAYPETPCRLQRSLQWKSAPVGGEAVAFLEGRTEAQSRRGLGKFEKQTRRYTLKTKPECPLISWAWCSRLHHRSRIPSAAGGLTPGRRP